MWSWPTRNWSVWSGRQIEIIAGTWIGMSMSTSSKIHAGSDASAHFLVRKKMFKVHCFISHGLCCYCIFNSLWRDFILLLLPCVATASWNVMIRLHLSYKYSDFTYASHDSPGLTVYLYVWCTVIIFFLKSIKGLRNFLSKEWLLGAVFGMWWRS